MAFAFPPIRLKEFIEHRFRSPVRGSLLNEETDIMLTEPIVPQLQRWLNSGENLVFAPLTTHVSIEVGRSRLVSICYTLLAASKMDAVHLLYGT